MLSRGRGLASPRLRQFVQRTAEGPPADGAAPDPADRCELCGLPLPETHRHLLDLERRRLLCACRACSLLFDRGAAGGGHYRLVPERRVLLDSFELSDAQWDQLRIPVDMAFFYRSSTDGRVRAYYPSPMGATESRLELSRWEDIERSNPVLGAMEADVEALLVDRTGEVPRQWIVPIEDCFRLVGVIRTTWRGFAGGREVWQKLERFFEELDRGAISVNQERR